MVVFTCNHCGESLHKPKVEKHYQFTCRNFKSVTCVDCFKDFRDEEYVAHTKCITEDERYAAKGTYSNGIVKKGDVKQESWVEMIKSICETEKNLKPSLRNLLNTISEYSNVPRKKQKFLNFIKSSSGNRANMKEVEEVWDIIEKYKEKNHAHNQKNVNNQSENKNKENTNGITKPDHQSKKRSMKDNEITEKESPKKKKKKSGEETAEENKQDVEDIQKKDKKSKKETVENVNEGNKNGNTEILGNSKKKKNKAKNKDLIVEESVQSAEAIQEQVEAPKFDFKEKIIEILTEKKRISLSKLQKKVVKAYIRTVGESNCEDKVIKKFNKKLKKISNVGIEDDRVVFHQ